MGSKKLRVFLIDVDGVMVEALAYRHTLRTTLELLLARFGIARARDFIPGPGDISSMEACGVHDVWDITCISFALVLERLFAFQAKSADSTYSVLDGEFDFDDLFFSLAALGTGLNSSDRPDYSALCKYFISTSSATDYPPSAAYDYIDAKMLEYMSSEDLEAARLAIASVLLHSRDVYENRVTRLFQELLLGAAIFEDTYGLPSSSMEDPILMSRDRVLIRPDAVAALREMSKAEDFCLSVYTARPSSPPARGESEEMLFGYSPEAELALDMASMSDFALVGMGAMRWLGEVSSKPVELLTKPHITHAMAALMSALEGGLSRSLLFEAGELIDGTRELSATLLRKYADREIEISVFEDTPAGVKPLVALVDFLSQRGLRLKLRTFGIAAEGGEKAAELSKYCERVFEDVNQALSFATGNLALKATSR